MLSAALRLAFLALLVFVPFSVGGAGEPTAGYGYSLFDGTDLDSFVVTGCKAEVKDGVLLLAEGDGLVRSAHLYADFVLELDCRPLRESGYDSGIYFRGEAPAEGSPWPARYQANLLQGKEGDVGGLSGAAGGAKHFKPGQWNQFKLTVVGDTAELEINGQPAWKASGIGSPAGYIGLQSEVAGGGQFEFKNIRVTELGYVPLFNGKDLAGWQGGGADAALCWRVENGELLCTGQEGPWLRSEQEYADFNLRLEYQLKAGGNSGVYVRVPHNGDHRGKSAGQDSAGVEVQILDDADERYAKLEPYQYCGSVYAIAAAEPRVSRPAGRWNSLEIDCRGPCYRVIHNGVLVVDADETKHPELKERLTSGFLGLQNHSEEVRFRNLRIGPAR